MNKITARDAMRAKRALRFPNLSYARVYLTLPGGNQKVWIYAGFFYVFQSSVRLSEVWLG